MVAWAVADTVLSVGAFTVSVLGYRKAGGAA